MKRFLLAIAVCITQLCCAQSSWRFVDSTANWSVLEATFIDTTGSNFGLTDLYTARVDTVIRGRSYQKIDKLQSNSFTIPLFVRRDSMDRIFIFRTDSDQLLYNFGAEKGDTVILTWGSSFENVHCIIDSVDTVFIGRERRRLFLHYFSFQVLPDIWIDGIGALSSQWEAPGGNSMVVDGGLNSMLCFFENHIEVLHNATYPFCFVAGNFTIGIKDVENHESITLYPNPVCNGMVQLKYAENGTAAFQLYDVTGKQILQSQIATGTNSILLNGVSPGMYYMQIINNKSIKTANFIKQ